MDVWSHRLARDEATLRAEDSEYAAALWLRRVTLLYAQIDPVNWGMAGERGDGGDDLESGAEELLARALRVAQCRATSSALHVRLTMHCRTPSANQKPFYSRCRMSV